MAELVRGIKLSAEGQRSFVEEHDFVVKRSEQESAFNASNTNQETIMMMVPETQNELYQYYLQCLK